MIQFIAVVAVVGYGVRCLKKGGDGGLSVVSKTLPEIIVISICVLFTSINIYIYQNAGSIYVPEHLERKERLNFLVSPHLR